MGSKRKHHEFLKNGLDSLDKNAMAETIKSTGSLSDFGEGRHNTTITVDFNSTGTGIQDTDEGEL